MASRADNLASNLSLANFSKATELKQRIWFTVGALIVFRFMSFVPMPGIDPIALKRFFASHSGGILDLFNMFSGGALSNYSLISLGIFVFNDQGGTGAAFQMVNHGLLSALLFLLAGWIELRYGSGLFERVGAAPPLDQSMEEAAIPIASHVAFGVTTAALFEATS